MLLCDVNPFVRYATLQGAVANKVPSLNAYDYRIFYITNPKGNLILSDRTVCLKRGMLIYIRPGVPYFFDNGPGAIVINFDMTREHSFIITPRPPETPSRFDPKRIIENDPPDELKYTIVTENAYDIEQTLQKCVLLKNYPDSYSDTLTSALIKEVLHYLAVNNKETEKRPSLVERIIIYIQNHYSEPLTNETISKVFGYHSYYLNRLFKEHTGTTLRQALISERVGLARTLLLTSDFTVNQIAQMVGFPERTSFCTSFKKKYGVSPLELRKSFFQNEI